MYRVSSLPIHLFPYDPAVDSALDHRHLVASYCVTWIIQFGYFLYAIRKNARGG